MNNIFDIKKDDGRRQINREIHRDILQKEEMIAK